MLVKKVGEDQQQSDQSINVVNVYLCFGIKAIKGLICQTPTGNVLLPGLSVFLDQAQNIWPKAAGA